MKAVSDARTQHERVLEWVQGGGTGGLEITLGASSLLRNALRVSGSGFGSVDLTKADLPGLMIAISNGVAAVRPRTAPLAEVEQAWAQLDTPGERTVILL